MINLDEITRQMTVNAAAIRALLEQISSEQATWKPDPQTWCLQQVIEHVYNEERIDFRQHIKEMFHTPPMAWGTLKEFTWTPVGDCAQALSGFLQEREASLGWLRGLSSPDWAASSKAQFGPAEVIVLSAADVLVSWVAHDYLHLRQINELLYAWNEAQAKPHSVQYAGGW